MPTYSHNKLFNNGDTDSDCMCEIDGDHWENGEIYDESESMSISDAADIWRSKGMDEDYTFGYSDEELRNA